MPSPSESEIIETYAHKIARKADVLDKGEPKIIQLPLTKEYIPEKANYRSYRFGETPIVSSEHKVVMLMGATGSGKSTLINAMINYIVGVKWEHNFRFKIVDDHGEGLPQSQAHSQTQIITSYTIYKSNHHNIPYTLTIIDTPGFGDTRGIERDKAITKLIRDFFLHSDSQHVDHIDAVGFVVQASQARLTAVQRYVFDSTVSVFGKDISENIVLLTTFADGLKPAVIDAVKEAHIPCSNDVFKFNNSGLFVSSGDVSGRMYWEMGASSMQTLFTKLDQLKPRSLTLTKEVLKERQCLEITIKGVQQQVELGLIKLENLDKEQKILEQHEQETQKNKCFSFEEKVLKHKKVDLDEGTTALNCLECEFTCHDSCGLFRGLPYHFLIMNWFGHCTVCPGHCSSSCHSVDAYRFEYYRKNVTRKYKDTEKRYKDATGKQLTVKEVIRKLEQDIEIGQKCIADLVEESGRILNRLDEIALKPNPLSTIDYIDLLIESEKREAKQGWQSRMKVLEDIRKGEDILKQVIEDGNAGSLVTQAGMMGKDKTQNTEHKGNKKK